MQVISETVSVEDFESGTFLELSKFPNSWNFPEFPKFHWILPKLSKIVKRSELQCCMCQIWMQSVSKCIIKIRFPDYSYFLNYNFPEFPKIPEFYTKMDWDFRKKVVSPKIYVHIWHISKDELITPPSRGERLVWSWCPVFAKCVGSK